MYLFKQIDVSLTQTNTELLRRPSKIFNSIKSMFSGEMTPTQQKQADVMLGVIQRLNIALRRAELSQLASIAVNEKLVYEAETNSTELEQSNTALVEGFQSGDIKNIDSIQIAVDGEDESLSYLISVSLMRKPKRQDTPVNITMYGFIREFGRHTGELDDAFSQRVKSLIAEHWGTTEQRQQKLDALEAIFEQKVTTLTNNIERQFPSGVTVSDTERRLREKPFTSKHSCHRNRYDPSFDYLPLFYLSTFGVYADEDDTIVYDNDSTDWERNQDASGAYAGGSESWADDMSFSDGGSDGGSSCGGGCGGGCGGS